MIYNCITINEIKPYPFTNDNIKNVGRYEKIIGDEIYILDVKFTPFFSRKWTNLERIEYLNGENGIYKNWKYNLNSKIIIDIIMMWINELEESKRNTHNILRNIMNHLSYQNYNEEGLIFGNWDLSNIKNDEIDPKKWNSTLSIFEMYIKNYKSVKYGQCWCFAECMTSICRILNIPCKTLYGKNILIDEQLDGGIDFFFDLKKDSENERTQTIDFYSINKRNNDFSIFIQSLTPKDNFKPKTCDINNLKIYNSGDAYWNIHYFNQIFIRRDNTIGWEIIDSTPIFESKENDDYNKKKILGPCKLSTFKTNHVYNFDYEQFFSYINSPYRLWVSDTIIENDKIVNISYVNSIIYTLNPNDSVYIKSDISTNIFNFKPSILSINPNNGLETDYTSDFISEYTREKYFNNMPTSGVYYCQFVYLNDNGNIIYFQRGIQNLPIIKPIVDFEYYILSILMIENEDIEIESNEEKYCNEKSTHWFTYLEYFN